MRQEIIDLYDEYTHRGLDRRVFLARLAELAGGSAAALALLPLLGANYARAAIVAEDDERIIAGPTTIPSVTGEIAAYSARPADRDTNLPGVIVIHENRGLNPHIQDVVRRFAVAGFLAAAPDFLTPEGGTPEDEDAARELIGKLERSWVTSRARLAVHWMKRQPEGNGRAGIVGFCWGGGVVGDVIVEDPDVDAAVIFYGRVPDPQQVRNIYAPVLGHYAELDSRITENVPAFRDALMLSGAQYEIHVYEGVNHAFHNDTSEARYDQAAAELAWERTVAFLKNHLETSF
jgi:carboxymethylenebutenolidase